MAMPAAGQVIRKSTAELDLSGNSGVVTPGGRFIPDATIVPDGALNERLSQPFGKGVEPPEPFGFTLDTAEFG